MSVIGRYRYLNKAQKCNGLNFEPILTCYTFIVHVHTTSYRITGNLVCHLFVCGDLPSHD